MNVDQDATTLKKLLFVHFVYFTNFEGVTLTTSNLFIYCGGWGWDKKIEVKSIFEKQASNFYFLQG